MFSHITLGITDIDLSLRFYRPVMEKLGWDEKFASRSAPGPWAGWTLPDSDGWPLFIITYPFDETATAAPGNGPMVAFRVATPALVDEVHTLAVSLGATNDGAPGLRVQYHPRYYGAYMRDPDGNKICVVCHDAGR